MDVTISIPDALIAKYQQRRSEFGPHPQRGAFLVFAPLSAAAARDTIIQQIAGRIRIMDAIMDLDGGGRLEADLTELQP